MRIVSTIDELAEHRRRTADSAAHAAGSADAADAADAADPVGPVCVLADSLDSVLAREAAALLDLRLPLRPGMARRPSAVVDGDRLELVLFTLEEDRSQHRVEVLAGPSGLLLAAPDAVVASLREHLAAELPQRAPQGADETPQDLPQGRPHDLPHDLPHALPHDVRTAFVLVVLGIARRSEQVLDVLEDDCQEIAERLTGYTSSPQRREIARLRTDLFRIQELQAAQQALLAADEEVAQHLAHVGAARRLLKRSAAAFGANRSLAERLYAMLGDVLAEQDAVVNERLTLVATIFLPLTLATGFFGMNFTWMQDQIGSPQAFALLGVAAPVAITLLTLLVVRRITRSA
ncbi:CorA family divalent cation transporter [Brachybacterium sp. DNPG3]